MFSIRLFYSIAEKSSINAVFRDAVSKAPELCKQYGGALLTRRGLGIDNRQGFKKPEQWA